MLRPQHVAARIADRPRVLVQGQLARLLAQIFRGSAEASRVPVVAHARAKSRQVFLDTNFAFVS